MTTKDIVLLALFAAIIGALGFVPAIPLPFIPVPITLQTLGVMLAGAILGPKRGFASIVVIWVLVAAGLPLLAPSRGGLMQFVGPTAGYLIGWGLGVFVIGVGYKVMRNRLSPVVEISILIFGGVIAIHLCGILWLAISGYTTLSGAFLMNLAFVPGDLIKVALTYYIASTLRKALPGKIE